MMIMSCYDVRKFFLEGKKGFFKAQWVFAFKFFACEFLEIFQQFLQFFFAFSDFLETREHVQRAVK
jgi:hypothetical protein